MITPQKLQGYAEQIVDGTYHWLEGKVKTPDFSIDLTSTKQDLGNAVGDTAVARLQGLPVCTLAQLQAINVEQIDPFSLPCQPPGLNLEAERQKLTSQIIQKQDVLQQTKLTATDTKSETTGKTPFEKLAILPTIFQWSKILPWVLSILGLAAAAGMVFLQSDHRKELKKISITLLVNGLLLCFSVWLTAFLLNHIQFQDMVQQRQFGEAVISIVRTLSSAFNRVVLIFGATYSILGIGGLVGLHFLKPKMPLGGHDSPANKPVEHTKDDTPEAKIGPVKA